MLRIRRRRVIYALFMALIVIVLTVRLRVPLIRWKLLNMAGGRRLLTFRSTPNWGIGNAMFAFSSTLAIARRRSDSGDLPPLFCFDAHLMLRAAFPRLADWPACSPSDVLELPEAEQRNEVAYAR